MKTNFRFTIVLALFAALFSSHADAQKRSAFRLTSPTVKPNAKLGNDQVFNGFGCAGNNISPALNWTGAPAGTKSFAVTVYDPDAPTGSGWWHWTIFNLPADTTKLAAGAGDLSKNLAPAGSAQGRTDFGKPGFGGACPPAGDKPHRYVFTVFALKTDKLPLDSEASGALVGFYLNQNTLAKATLTATYSR